MNNWNNRLKDEEQKLSLKKPSFHRQVKRELPKKKPKKQPAGKKK